MHNCAAHGGVTFRCRVFRGLSLSFQFLCGDSHPYGASLYYALCIINYALEKYQVVIAAGSHLFPFRTEKLSPPAPMVLQCNAGE